jgi:predicted dehydrogenase
MLNLALIGLGNMGSLHLKNVLLLEQTGLCRLSCVCDIKTELADKIGNECRVPAYNSVECLLGKQKIDAAIIATTSSSHFEPATGGQKTDEIKAFVIERTGLNTAGFSITVIEEIPRNESGKVLYAKLEELYD